MPSELPKPWITRTRTELYDARPWLRLYGDDVELPDGRQVQGFYSIDMPDHAIIVALTSEDRVVVERNYKHGPRRVCINLPAGYLEPGEDPMDAAKRELLEDRLRSRGLVIPGRIRGRRESRLRPGAHLPVTTSAEGSRTGTRGSGGHGHRPHDDA